MENSKYFLAACLAIACAAPAQWQIGSRHVRASSQPVPSLGVNAAWNGRQLISPLTGVDLTALPVDPNDALLRANFGYQGTHLDNSMPYNIVRSSVTGFQPISVDAATGYPTESDLVQVPFNSSVLVEGTDPTTGVIAVGDNHLLVWDLDTDWLYEVYHFRVHSDGTYGCDSLTVWDADRVTQRPWTYTSADLAGLSILSGLLRYDEASTGTIGHAVRMTMPYIFDTAITPPASHTSGNCSSNGCVTAGARLKLRPDFDASALPPILQNIAAALKRYGGIAADLGGAFYFSTDTNSSWNASGTDFAAWNSAVSVADLIEVTASPTYTALPPGTEAAPVISTFTATHSGSTTVLAYTGTIGVYGYAYIQGGHPFRGTSTAVPYVSGASYTLVTCNRGGCATATATAP